MQTSHTIRLQIKGMFSAMDFLLSTLQNGFGIFIWILIVAGIFRVIGYLIEFIRFSVRKFIEKFFHHHNGKEITL